MRYEGRLFLVSFVLLMLGRIAAADEWKLSGALNQGAEYNDNIALRTVPSAVFGYLLNPSFGANWRTAISDVGITGRGDIRRYDDERWNCDNFSLGANQKYLRKRHVFSISGGYSQSCTYSQQLSDTGILIPNNQTEKYDVAPIWSWQLAPLDQLTLSPSYSETKYSTTQLDDNFETNVSFRNNKSYSFNLSENHSWNHRLSTNGSLFYSLTEFSYQGGSSRQTMFGFQLGGQYAISRAWSIKADGGLRWVETPSAGATTGGNSTDSPLLAEVGNLDLDYKGQHMNYSLSYSRSVNPSAFGELLEYNSLSMKYSYQLTKELSFSLDGSLSENQGVGQSQNQTAQNRRFFTASTEMVWKFAKQWNLSASYRYRRQEYQNLSGAQADSALASMRDSNSIMLHLNYNWDGWRVSR